MTHFINKTRFATAILAAAMAANGVLAAQNNERRTTQSFAVGPNGELSLSNIAGDIRVEGTSGNEITVETVKRLRGSADSDLLDAVEVGVSHTGNRVRIETRYPRGRWRGRDDHHDHGSGGVTVSYQVSVPVGTEVEVTSVSGNVEVSGVDGETSASSVSGTVRVSDAANLVRAKSVSGDVEVQGARSEYDLEVASVSGSVAMSDIEVQELDVSTVSGDVGIDDVSCEEGEFDSTSGTIRYTGRILPGGDYEFNSHSGDVIVTLGDDVGFELEANTFSGDVDSDFEMRISSRGRRGRNLNAVVGDGSAVIEANTFSGDIVLRKR